MRHVDLSPPCDRTGKLPQGLHTCRHRVRRHGSPGSHYRCPLVDVLRSIAEQTIAVYAGGRLPSSIQRRTLSSLTPNRSAASRTACRLPQPREVWFAIGPARRRRRKVDFALLRSRARRGVAGPLCVHRNRAACQNGQQRGWDLENSHLRITVSEDKLRVNRLSPRLLSCRLICTINRQR